MVRSHDLRELAAGLLIDHQEALAAALVAIVLGALVLFVAAPASARAMGDFRPDCTVRAVGSDFNLELSGWRAGAACRHLVATTRGLSEGSTSGAVICIAHVQGLTETVRDDSFLPLVGSLICAGIHGTRSSAQHSAGPGFGGTSL